MTTALLFPGQGTDLADAVAAWRAGSSHVRRLVDVAADALDEPPDALTRPVALARTEVAQAVLTALGIGIAREVVERGVLPDAVAGHSVGEIAACAVAGAMDDAAAVRLAAARGRLMAREASRRPGGMVSVRASASELAAMLASAGDHLCVAVHNASGEWVLSGDLGAIRGFAARWPATPVPTPGAWHSPAMRGAHDEYERALRDAVRAPLALPVICNRTGEVVRDAAAIPALLADQLTHPVLWADSMATLAALGVERVIACGPGRALRRFAREALPHAAFADLSSPAPLADLALPATP